MIDAPSEMIIIYHGELLLLTVVQIRTSENEPFTVTALCFKDMLST